MADFAKLYTYPDYGQVVVIIQPNDDGVPEIRCFGQPERLGVCAMAVSYSDDNEGWDLAEKVFSEMTEESVKKLVSPLYNLPLDDDE